MVQPVFRNEVHKSLWTPVSKHELKELEDSWNAFTRVYPEWERFRDSWLTSRKEHVSPLSMEIPWINFESLEWLSSFLTPSMSVFEWGSGGSTVYFSQRASHVTSIEHDSRWIGVVQEHLKSFENQNFTVELIEPDALAPLDVEFDRFLSKKQEWKNKSFRDYCRAVNKFQDGSLDVIIVDGRCRTTCLELAIPKVKLGGLLMLDNADYDYYQDDIKRLEDTVLSTWEMKSFLAPGPCSRIIGWETRVWINS